MLSEIITTRHGSGRLPLVLAMYGACSTIRSLRSGPSSAGFGLQHCFGKDRLERIAACARQERGRVVIEIGIGYRHVDL